MFAVAWRKVDSIPEGADALPWLYGMARNEIRNRRRSIRRLRALTDKIGGQAQPLEPGPEGVVVRSRQLEELMKAFASLRSKDPEVLMLRTHEELDYQQMAIAIGASPEAARKRFARAIVRLRRAAGISPEPKPTASETRAIQKGGDR